MMMDQAFKLRELMDKNKVDLTAEKLNKDAKILTVSSGKGGVGKTNFTVNLAIALGSRGKRVTLIDADLGLANVDIVLGLVPQYTLSNVIKGEKHIEDVIMEGPHGIKVLSGGSGVMDIVELSKEQLDNLINSFKHLNENSDYILIDTGAGLNSSVLSFIKAADEVIMVVTSDPTSLTDAYAVIKNISDLDTKINIIANRVESNKEGREVYQKLNLATTKFLGLTIENLGCIYEDSNVKKAVKKQVPFISSFPNSIASKSVEMIAFNIDNNSNCSSEIKGFRRFIKRLLNG